MLNEALATEIVCVLRYKRHYFMAAGHQRRPGRRRVPRSTPTRSRATPTRSPTRITQLQGEPELQPGRLTARSHAEYVEGTTLVDMISEDLVAERIAIESYSEIIRWLGDKDPTTRRLMEDILAVEEEHADDLLDILQTPSEDH